MSCDTGGLKKLESLSDVPRAYAGLPFLSLLVPASPFRGIWWAQEARVTLRRTACLCGSSFSFASCSRFPFQGNLVGSSGLEPPTSRLSGARSSLLSYEPVSFPVVLPVSLPKPSLVEMMGFEPMTPCLQGRCSPN